MNAETSPCRSVGARGRWRSWAAGALLGTLAALLAACGPGVGGTGTGVNSAADGLQAFGAQAASACVQGASASPACPASSGPTSGGGTPVEVWLDVTAGARIRLEVQGNAATLERRCTRERFLGQWGTSPLVGARYFGVYGDEGVPGVAASLSVRAADGGTLVLELRGIDERLLLPPVTVQRVAGALPPPLCP